MIGVTGWSEARLASSIESGLTNGFSSAGPQGLKPAFLSALNGTAEAVPYTKTIHALPKNHSCALTKNRQIRPVLAFEEILQRCPQAAEAKRISAHYQLCRFDPLAA